MTNDFQKFKRKVVKEISGEEGKKERIRYTASFPSLVDLVLNGEEVKFLTYDKELLNEVFIDNIKYIPPPVRGLPPQLRIPRAENVLKYAQEHEESGKSGVSGACKVCTLLFDDLVIYHKAISELPDKDLYILLTTYDIHTYMIDRFNFSPIIYFYSIAERGKSRTIKGMINVAYRGIRKADITDAQLLRDCTNLKATIAFDMMDFWSKVKSAGSVDVVLNRYEKGLTVSRVNRPEKGAFQDTDYFDVFGCTLLGTNEVVHEIADTRSICIIMKKADSDFEEEVTPEMGLPFRERLLGFKLAHYNDKLLSVNKIVRSRLGDIIRPLHQTLLMVSPDKEKTFIELVKRIEKVKLTEKVNSLDAEVIQAWMASKKEIFNGVIACKYVADELNQGKNEKEKITSRRVGSKLRSYGFQSTQTVTNTLGFFWSDDITEKLRKEYGLSPVALNPLEALNPQEKEEDLNLEDLDFGGKL